MKFMLNASLSPRARVPFLRVSQKEKSHPSRRRRSKFNAYILYVIPPEISTVLFVSCAQLHSSSVLCLAAPSNAWYVLRFIQIGKFIHKIEIFYFLRISTLATSSSAESSRTIPRLFIWAHRSSLALCVLSSIAVVSRCVWNFTVDREIISSQSCALRSCRNNRLRTAYTKAISLRKSSRAREEMRNCYTTDGIIIDSQNNTQSCSRAIWAMIEYWILSP